LQPISAAEAKARDLTGGLPSGSAFDPADASAAQARHPVSMADFLAGYVVPAGAGLADDPGLKASQRSTGGAWSVFETRVGAGPPLHVPDREEAADSVPPGSAD
jgi:hypothetical protein